MLRRFIAIANEMQHPVNDIQQLFRRGRTLQVHCGRSCRIGADDDLTFQVCPIILQGEAEHVGRIIVIQKLAIKLVNGGIVDNSQADHCR